MNLHYPVKHCHFCNQIMMYNRYTNGDHYVYCNSSTNLSCMGFTYCTIDDKIKIKEFTISDTDILSFRNFMKKAADGSESYSNTVLVQQIDASPQTVKVLENLLYTDPDTILSKIHSLKLLDKVKKAILLVD
jgi:hypothetical protein